jgi:hypothetical protein
MSDSERIKQEVRNEIKSAGHDALAHWFVETVSPNYTDAELAALRRIPKWRNFWRGVFGVNG